MPETNEQPGPAVSEFNLPAREPSLSPEELLVGVLKEKKKEEAGIGRHIEVPEEEGPILPGALGGEAVEAVIRTEAQRLGLTDADLEKHGRALAYLLEEAAEGLERKFEQIAIEAARNAVRRLKASLLEQAARGS